MENRKIAILIGSSEFPEDDNLINLRCPVKDVEGMEKVLNQDERGAFDKVVSLKNKPSSEVIPEIQRNLNSAKKDDLVLIYYSGHGKLNRGGKLHLTTPNTDTSTLESTSISVSQIREFIDVSSCNKVIIIFDCCFSGAVGKVFTKGGVDDQLQSTAEARGTFIMTASTGIQAAEEKEEDDFSVFTKNIIHGIESGEADTNKDGVITVEELYNYVHHNVMEESAQQPTKWGFDMRGEFVIAQSGKQPREDRARDINHKLLDLFRDGKINRGVLNGGLDIAERKYKNLTPREAAFDDLLDQLLNHEVSIPDFIYKWAEIEHKRESDFEADLAELEVSAPNDPDQSDGESFVENELPPKEEEEVVTAVEDESKETFEEEAEVSNIEDKSRQETIVPASGNFANRRNAVLWVLGTVFGAIGVFSLVESKSDDVIELFMTGYLIMSLIIGVVIVSHRKAHYYGLERGVLYLGMSFIIVTISLMVLDQMGADLDNNPVISVVIVGITFVLYHFLKNQTQQITNNEKLILLFGASVILFVAGGFGFEDEGALFALILSMITGAFLLGYNVIRANWRAFILFLFLFSVTLFFNEEAATGGFIEPTIFWLAGIGIIVLFLVKYQNVSKKKEKAG